jgi:CopG family transcriptional regulator, nickel-responsive regulator
MQRLTISVNKQLASSFDQLIARKGYRNRSEAFRDLLRKTLSQDTLAAGPAGQCVACVSYVFDNRQRRVAERLAELRQRFSGVAVSATLAPIDRDSSMETLILRGDVDAVARLADAITAETGVRHGQLNLVPIAETAEDSAVADSQYA